MHKAKNFLICSIQLNIMIDTNLERTNVEVLVFISGLYKCLCNILFIAFVTLDAKSRVTYADIFLWRLSLQQYYRIQ